MPVYLHHEVTARYLHDLVGAYWDGYAQGGGDAALEVQDDTILILLAAHEAESPTEARRVGFRQARTEGSRGNGRPPDT